MSPVVMPKRVRTFATHVAGLILLVAGVLSWIPAAEAQPAGKIPRIGFLSTSAAALVDAFRDSLRELGYAEEKTS